MFLKPVHVDMSPMLSSYLAEALNPLSVFCSLTSLERVTLS